MMPATEVTPEAATQVADFDFCGDSQKILERQAWFPLYPEAKPDSTCASVAFDCTEQRERIQTLMTFEKSSEGVRKG